MNDTALTTVLVVFAIIFIVSLTVTRMFLRWWLSTGEIIENQKRIIALLERSVSQTVVANTPPNSKVDTGRAETTSARAL